MINSTRPRATRNGLPAWDQPRFAAAVVSCANVLRRPQELEPTRGPRRSAGARYLAQSPQGREVPPSRPRACTIMLPSSQKLCSKASTCCAPVCQPPVAARRHEVALTASGYNTLSREAPSRIHFDKPKLAAGHRSKGRGERLSGQCEGGARDRVAAREDRPTALARSPEANGGHQDDSRAAAALGFGCTRPPCGRRTAAITSGY